MKLSDLNIDKVLNKYDVKKGSLAKDLSTGDPDKTDFPDRSGNQNTPVPKKAQKLMGTKDNGMREPDLVNKV